MARREKKRKYNSSSSGTGQLQPDIEDIDYDSMGMEDKINLILSKVTVNENRLRTVDQKCDKMFDKVYSHGKKLSEMSNVVVSHDDRMRLLEYKSIELEARSRRNNVLFYGLREARAQQDCKRLLCDFLQVEMGINVSESDMSRAHRLGKFNQTKTRPIIAAFQDYNIAEKIIKNGHTLREKVYSVSRDYPVEITRARKTLWPQYKRLKQENPLAKVAIVYPAKLISNGELVTDMFPEWDAVLRGSRIDLGHPSQQSYANKLSSIPNGPYQTMPMSNEPRPNHEITSIAANTDSGNRMEVTYDEPFGTPGTAQVISDAGPSQEQTSQREETAGDDQNIASGTSGASGSNSAASSSGSGFKTPSTTGNVNPRSQSAGRSRPKSKTRGGSVPRSTSRSRLKMGETDSGTNENPAQTESSA